MPVPHLSSKSEFDEYLGQCEALILYFTATWCGPCRAIAPVMEQLYTSYPTVEIVKVDLDSHKQLASQYSIAAVPTFVAIHKGKEIDRVRGANVDSVHAQVKKLSELAPQGKRRAADGGSSGSSSGSEYIKREKEMIKGLVGKGFKVLNSTVFFGEFESLNCLPAGGNTDVKNIVRREPEGVSSRVMSDADAQMLFHIPLTNVSKLSSILIQIEDKALFGQLSKVKVWINRSSIISFEDATSLPALHEEEVDFDKFNDWGFYEIKLKYVRFQKVSSIDLFIDGEDEDEHTVIDRILLVGVDGESKNQGKIEKIGHDQ